MKIIQKILWALALSVPFICHAQTSVMIWPLDPVLEEDQRAAALWLENRGTRPVSLQIRVLAWSQNGIEESFDTQDGVQPSPPVAVIQPGQRQLVRLMKTIAVPDDTEAAYRILVDELPQTDTGGAQEGGGGEGNSMGIKLQIRYSVPLFVSGKNHWTRVRTDRKRDPSTAAQPALLWRTEKQGDDYFLIVRNTGSAHARLTAVQWTRGNDVRSINPGLLGYVLANTQMRWRLQTPPPAGYGLQSKVNGGDSIEITAR